MFKNLFILFAMVLFAGSSIAQTNEDLYFVFLNTNSDKEIPGTENAKALQTGHLENNDLLAKEGKLFANGSLKDGGEIMILHAESLEQAKDFLQSDPAVQANSFTTEVFSMQLAHGNMCSAKPHSEMATYQLIRFKNVAYDIDRYSQVAHDNRVFMSDLQSKKKNIVAQAYFNEGQSDGVLILNAESADAAKKIFKKYKAVKSGDITYEVKTLRIAKGTFCE